MNTTFVQLNAGWNADPNVPEPEVEVAGANIVLCFFLNAFQFSEFREGQKGVLRFLNVERYRLGATNDEGWYRGHCRFSKSAPAWGEFYEVSGSPALLDAPADWNVLGAGRSSGRHFLFYFRDSTFECVAERCEAEPPLALRSSGPPS
jgi:hypothetical protein